MLSESGTPIHPIATIGTAPAVDLHMPPNRRLPVTVQAEFTMGRLKNPAVSRGEVPVSMRDPPFAFVGVAVVRPGAQHAIESVVQTLEDPGTPHAGIVPRPSHNDWIEQADQGLLAGMAMVLDDQPQVLDLALDRLGTGHDPRLVAQQTSPRVFR